MADATRTTAPTQPRVIGAVTFTSRPMPSAAVASIGLTIFEPDRSLARWIQHTFIRDGAALYNPDHAHLAHANVGIVWTNIPFRHHERWLVATAETPNTMGGAWKKGRAAYQLVDWFGHEPDFLITLYAPTLAKVTDRDFCAILEHELYHCAHATTNLGAPRFHRDGRPIFGIRGHDVEEFIGVVRRYGARGDVAAMVQAAKQSAIVSDAQLSQACGVCAGIA